MASFKTLVELLGELTPIEVELRREDDLVAVAVVMTAEGRRILLVERTYRAGVRFILDPTPEELQQAREGDLWKVWGSERSLLLTGII